MKRKISTRKLAYLIEFAEARAYVDMVHAAPQEWGFRAEESETATVLIAPTLDIPLFNRAIGIGLRIPASEQVIESIVDVYYAAGVRNYAIQISPATRPQNIKELLAERDLVVRDNWAKVYRWKEPVIINPGPLQIQRITQEHAGTFAGIACAAFNLPDSMQFWLTTIVGRHGWYHYLAWDGPEAIAAAALYIYGNVGWLGVAGTLPAYRKRGAQSNLMARRIQDGREAGCEWFVTETGEDIPERPNSSFHNMLRNGFKLAYQRPNYMRKTRPS